LRSRIWFERQFVPGGSTEDFWAGFLLARSPLARWQVGKSCPQLGHATTSDVAQSRRAHRGRQHGTSSWRHRYRLRRSLSCVFSTWRRGCAAGTAHFGANGTAAMATYHAYQIDEDGRIRRDRWQNSSKASARQDCNRPNALSFANVSFWAP